MAYTPCTSIAEKLEAILVLGTANSRVKDYFDIALLASTMAFDGETLCAAMRACCKRRGTRLPEEPPIGLSDDFGTDEAVAQHWTRFRDRLGEGVLDGGWEQVVSACRDFLAEPLGAAARGESWPQVWRPSGPWREL